MKFLRVTCVGELLWRRLFFIIRRNYTGDSHFHQRRQVKSQRLQVTVTSGSCMVTIRQ